MTEFLFVLILLGYAYHVWDKAKANEQREAERELHRQDIQNERSEAKAERSELISRIQSPSAIEFAQSQAIEKVYMRPHEEPLRSDADEARYVASRRGTE